MKVIPIKDAEDTLEVALNQVKEMKETIKRLKQEKSQIESLYHITREALDESLSTFGPIPMYRDIEGPHRGRLQYSVNVGASVEFDLEFLAERLTLFLSDTKDDNPLCCVSLIPDTEFLSVSDREALYRITLAKMGRNLIKAATDELLKVLAKRDKEKQNTCENGCV